MNKYLQRFKTPRERFFEKVDKSLGCWRWFGAISANGYGSINISGKMIRAHRYSIELHTGKKVPRQKVVCHKCDNKLCVNPNHLYIGTQVDNERDKKERNRIPRGSQHGRNTMPERTARGERHGMAFLKECDVREIRRLDSTGNTRKKIASMFGVGTSCVGQIVRRNIWKHIK